MDFEKEKALYPKTDKSKKGSIDKPIAKLIKKINSIRSFYTTSSCSGRIMLIETRSGKKQDTHWSFVTHDVVKPDKLIKAYDNYKNENTVLRFRMEGAIIHIAARDIDKAQDIVDIAKLSGFKRSGIIATKKRVMVEAISTELIDAPVIIDGVKYADKDYLEKLTEESNIKLKQTWKKIKKFEGLLEKF